MAGLSFQRIAAWDVRVSLALQRRRSAFLDRVLAAFSWSGAGGVWFGISLPLTAAESLGHQWVPRQRELVSSMFGAFVALIIGGVIKSLAGRTRPFAGGHGITRAVWAPGEHRSMPSTHAATSVALAVALLVVAHPFAWPVAAWAAVVTFSRVWLGVHFLSDVTVGSMLGIAVGLAPWPQLLEGAFALLAR